MRDKRRGTAFSRFKEKARSLVQRQNSLPAPIRNLGVITNHIKNYFGENFFVLHEIKSTLVHIDINVVLPIATRPYYTLLTSGMSDRPMRVPRGLAKLALAEVCLCLPGDWPISQRDMKWAAPEYFWPLAVLKQVARYAVVPLLKEELAFKFEHDANALEHKLIASSATELLNPHRQSVIPL